MMLMPSTIAVVLVLGLVLLPFLIQYLWNSTVSELFEVKTINYWHALRLLILCKILFASTVYTG
ncbi:hypothetical protein FCL40_11650 [Ferrimonas sediminicola]|uniref:Uncharacterized protein n=1 Tax=Ferrimonas sediminicola TaxID=2569538 RepID=A0A4U1BBL6_9GAMM|nr:hypothetical protein FCL40_11650 [Ferrimonas sediminicola]